jgi:hypothetical protein
MREKWRKKRMRRLKRRRRKMRAKNKLCLFFENIINIFKII